MHHYHATISSQVSFTGIILRFQPTRKRSWPSSLVKFHKWCWRPPRYHFY